MHSKIVSVVAKNPIHPIEKKFGYKIVLIRSFFPSLKIVFSIWYLEFLSEEPVLLFGKVIFLEFFKLFDKKMRSRSSFFILGVCGHISATIL